MYRYIWIERTADQQMILICVLTNSEIRHLRFCSCLALYDFLWLTSSMVKSSPTSLDPSTCSLNCCWMSSSRVKSSSSTGLCTLSRKWLIIFHMICFCSRKKGFLFFRKTFSISFPMIEKSGFSCSNFESVQMRSGRDRTTPRSFENLEKIRRRWSESATARILWGQKGKSMIRGRSARRGSKLWISRQDIVYKKKI